MPVCLLLYQTAEVTCTQTKLFTAILFVGGHLTRFSDATKRFVCINRVKDLTSQRGSECKHDSLEQHGNTTTRPTIYKQLRETLGEAVKAASITSCKTNYQDTSTNLMT